MNLIINNEVVEKDIPTDLREVDIAAFVKENYGDDVNFELVLTDSEKSRQSKIKIRGNIYNNVGDLDSLLGKTANFTAAIANIQLHMMGALLKAQSFEEFKTKLVVYAPFIQQLQSMTANGEIMSVQSAQGGKDTDAIIEGLTALTQVARVIKAAKE